MNEVAAGTFDSPIVNFLYGLPLVIAVVCGIIFLSAIAVRAKWDRTLRRHFLWFVLFLVALLGSLFSGLIIVPITFLFAGFALYRSAKSLVPLNRISTLVVAPKTKPPLT